MNEVEALRRVYARLRELVDAVGPGDMGRSVPGTAWDVRGLLGHLVVSIGGFASLLRQGQPAWDNVRGDHAAAAVRKAMRSALAQWRRPGAVDIPSQMIPGMRVVDVALADAVAHTWDLAAALDQEHGLDDDVVGLAYRRWATGISDPRCRYMLLGPDVTMFDGAPVLDRLLALLGRTRPAHAGEAAGAGPAAQRGTNRQASHPGDDGATSVGGAGLQRPARAEGDQHHQRDAHEQ